MLYQAPVHVDGDGVKAQCFYFLENVKPQGGNWEPKFDEQKKLAHSPVVDKNSMSNYVHTSMGETIYVG